MTDPASLAVRMLDLRLGDAEREAYGAAARRATEGRWAERLFEKDASLWSDDESVQEAIRERLGWLDAPAEFRDRVASLEAFGEAAREAGFTTALIVGMGGSSLAGRVLAGLFGAVPDWLELRVLDTTHPSSIAATLDGLDPLATQVVLATKSGTTVETLALQASLWSWIERPLHAHHAPRWESPGDLMVAITDPDALRSIPHRDRFREVFLNPPNLSSRYGPLTYTGLVPASLLGIDLDPLLDSAALTLERCRRSELEENPGLALGLALGSLARAGRDKLTLLLDPELAAFGAWIEQLVAESTGKQAVGIVPIDGEPVGAPEAYGEDRVFVRIALRGRAEPGPLEPSPFDALLAGLQAGGKPVVRIELDDPIDIGGEFVRWQVAVAFAGALLGVNPFDQPSVEESKIEIARTFGEHGAGHDGRPEASERADRALDEALAEADGLRLFGDAALRLSQGDRTVPGELARHLARLRPAGYVGLQAFLPETADHDRRLASIRALIRDRTRRPVTLGYGPRYLHSTGQLHKAGPPLGCFIQLTEERTEDRPIPGRSYTFGSLLDAQAAADFAALEARDLPVLRIALGPDTGAALESLERALAAALPAVGGG